MEKRRDTRPQTEDVLSGQGLDWLELGLKKSLVSGLYASGYEWPSPVQEQVIPAVLAGHDVLARAKNGTGKTGAFAIPMLQAVDPSVLKIQALVLVPTRELALQTSALVQSLGRDLGLRLAMTTGGSSVRNDVIRLEKGVHVIVGSPGRILDLANKRVCDLSHCKVVALDEADKLLSTQFVDVIEHLLAFIPRRQLILISATFPNSVAGFVQRWLRPGFKQVNLMQELTLKGITQYYAILEEKDKLHCLHTLLSTLLINQCVLFCNSVRRVELLARKINALGVTAHFIHAHMDQKHRNKVFHRFKLGAVRALVSSDLCTRGMDVPAVNVVVNFDMPSKAETYLHRIGRSGRFGHFGLAINFVTQADIPTLTEIESSIGAQIQPLPETIPPNQY